MMLVKYLSSISLNERIVFLKLLFRWQGSVWKLLWGDFVWYMALYTSLSWYYRYYLVYHEQKKEMFENFVVYANKIGSIVPLSFLLGFFVTTILGRWWQMINTIPWLSTPSFLLQSYISDGENPSMNRKIRLTITRYMNLSWILALTTISRQIKERFRPARRHDEPDKNIWRRVTLREKLSNINEDPVVKECYGKLILPEEIEVFEAMQQEAADTADPSKPVSYTPEYWLPLQWAVRVVERARQRGLVPHIDRHYIPLTQMINDFRSGLGTLGLQNEFNIPLVYTQVVVIAVYSFFLSELLTQQFVEGEPAVTLPLVTTMKFLFYMGWFKIGLSLINPLSSKHDFPISDILDYNLRTAVQCSAAEDKVYPSFLRDKFGSVDGQLQKATECIDELHDTALRKDL